MIKKVIQVTILHPRYDTRIYQKISKSLAKKYNVILLCSDGKGNEIKNSIEILDLGILKKSNFFFRILLNFRLIIKCFSLKGDYYHLHDPELIFAGILLRLFNYKVIFDSHEHVPDDILNKDYIPKNIRLITKIIYVFLEKFLLKFYSGLIAATPYIRDHLSKINNNTIDICNYPILNNPEEKDIKEVVQQANYPNYICYVGGIAKIRGIRELVQALELTKNKVILNLAGNFSPASFEHELKNLPGWKNVNYLGYLSKDQVHKVYTESLMGIVTLHPTRAFIYSLPVKMFEYMSYKLPLIASNFKLFCDIFNDSKCGLNVDPCNPKEIAQAIDDLIKNPTKRYEMGKNGYQAIMNKYNWDIEEKKLFSFYKKL
jgi:glycosyltransferase involved in cell wall biosynthesis